MTDVADTLVLTADEVVATAARIGREVLAVHADAVDAGSRFPAEAVAALREVGLLGALVPVELGGLGQSLETVARAVTELGKHCSSAAMVFAMHQIQVACLVDHGHTPVLRAYTERVAREGLLLASATTEVGTGGDVRSSSCAVEVTGDSYRLRKQAPVISYGEHADGVLATSRRTPDSPPSDQVLVVCRTEQTTLEPTSEWDVLGFRGTCSLGFVLTSTGSVEEILPVPYGDISSQTMLPVSHVLWSSLWFGMASAAEQRARKFVQGAARRTPGTLPPSAARLAELAAVHQQFRDLVEGGRRRYAAARQDPGSATSVGYAIAMNTLKVSASTLVVDVVQRSLLICGMAGYATKSPFSLGRLLRDSYGAQLMVNNDRIHANNSQLLLMHRSEGT
ncbi:acyl-CoA dehydrogenase [Marmoricola sp. Leaf446]|uniref:acyl-CoA dehydrogenase family protein n=1 Tax=Marmoricola sp. Leaf446 TaxID=1736379 RepID=UPI0006FF064C|nr:acyl-CoA dehydrogenase family protein [Marmoricola sp. Leaf446]KQT90929.1 acyl-CoA dehydrogenase [Marmoricola sp. Leaf446]